MIPEFPVKSRVICRKGVWFWVYWAVRRGKETCPGWHDVNLRRVGQACGVHCLLLIWGFDSFDLFISSLFLATSQFFPIPLTTDGNWWWLQESVFCLSNKQELKPDVSPFKCLYKPTAPPPATPQPTWYYYDTYTNATTPDYYLVNYILVI